ncbi:MAG: hypothetical protein COA63_001085 [Methylophaga sp.]|nr:hypothetical protein [Methylophaga sp.]
MKSRSLLLLATKETLATIIRTRFWFSISSLLSAGAHIPADFFGINIAPSSDPRLDDYTVERLKELQLKHIRMDFTYDSFGGDAERLLKRILAEKFMVMLDLLPPKKDAALLASDDAAQQRWQQFITRVNKEYGKKIVCFEIGATPNRSKWSGFDLNSYLSAWKIAYTQLEDSDHLLAGPNVSDFEPISNITLLADMQQNGSTPCTHTDNLFVERVIEPEAYDHRVFGRLLANKFKLNLVKKARIYNELSEQYGCRHTVCTYTDWTSKRLARFSDTPETKKADYLVRYLVITATSQALDQVYWGPLICNRDGIIGDGAADYPEIDNVSFYKSVRGKYENLKIRPAFYALANTIKQLSNTDCIQAANGENGIHHFIFTRENDSELHIAWLRDRYTLPLDSLYSSKQLDAARFIDTVGQKQDPPPICLSERPIFIEFNSPQRLSLTVSQIEQLDVPATPIFASINNVDFISYHTAEWQGAVAIQRGESVKDKIDHMLPYRLLDLPQISVHRDQRNKVWSSKNPVNSGETIVIKENRATGMRKLSYHFKASKGERHWNNASEMIRRGVSSPMPIAYFEHSSNAATRHNYYVCEYVSDAFSARDAFTAFAQGKEEYAGFSKQAVFQALAQYTCKMHNRRIIHNDLSGGNLLMTKTKQNHIKVTAIDIGRATVHPLKGKKITQKMRLIDLCRLCYKLDWPNRKEFMHTYFKEFGHEFDKGWSKPLRNYDRKHQMKRKIKGFLKKKKTK